MNFVVNGCKGLVFISLFCLHVLYGQFSSLLTNYELHVDSACCPLWTLQKCVSSQAKSKSFETFLLHGRTSTLVFVLLLYEERYLHIVGIFCFLELERS